MELTSQTPRAPYRATLTQIKCSSEVRHLHSTHEKQLPPPLDTKYGADPNLVDFDIDKDKTFREGTLYELIPPVDTFVQLQKYISQSHSTDDNFRERWRATTRQLIDKHRQKQDDNSNSDST